MCYQLIERYAVCGCLYHKHAVDPCAQYGQYGHSVQEKTVLVGYACSVHSTGRSSGSAVTTCSPFYFPASCSAGGGMAEEENEVMAEMSGFGSGEGDLMLPPESLGLELGGGVASGLQTTTAASSSNSHSLSRAHDRRITSRRGAAAVSLSPHPAHRSASTMASRAVLLLRHHHPRHHRYAHRI